MTFIHRPSEIIHEGLHNKISNVEDAAVTPKILEELDLLVDTDGAFDCGVDHRPTFRETKVYTLVHSDKRRVSAQTQCVWVITDVCVASA